MPGVLDYSCRMDMRYVHSPHHVTGPAGVDVQFGGLRSIVLMCALALFGCAQTRGVADAGSSRFSRSSPTEIDRESRALIARATPGNLAAAALLMSLDDRRTRQPLDLIERAEALAPLRPELVWLHLRICERLGCGRTAQIAAHLQALDPDNGFAWALDLEREQSSGPAAVTALIARIGAAPRMTLYWNQLEVMMVDALAVANPTQDLATRGTDAAGLLAAQIIPPLRSISEACRLERLDLRGRRVACEAMVARMEQSSTVLTQSLALSLEERWWPAGSPQREVVDAKRRRLDYLMTMSSRIRWWRMNRDMAIRIDAARQTEREEDAELAVVRSFGLPAEPPARWKDPLHVDQHSD